MTFQNICNKIAINVLGRPGTVVECMNAIYAGGTLEKGKIYNVTGNYFIGSDPFLKIGEHCDFWATRFRKVEQ